jgi:hypothetical protein
MRQHRGVEESLQKLRYRPNNWLPTSYVEGIPRLADFVSIARNDNVGTFSWVMKFHDLRKTPSLLTLPTSQIAPLTFADFRFLWFEPWLLN